MQAFLLVDKESGWTSHDVVAKVRNLTGIKKVGHSGTLDPMATGLLVLGLGRATRLLRFVQDMPKEYLARALFGVATDSLDAEGSILSREAMPVDEAATRAAMTRFVGPIMQVPPMVSARKVEGRRLYELARRGEVVEREQRPVMIYSIDLVEFAPSEYPEVTFRVRCSSGTYVRTLADDVARAMGGRAHLTGLRRIANGSLNVGQALTIGQVEAAVDERRLDRDTLPPSEALADLPAVRVDAPAVAGVANGVALPRRFFAPELEVDAFVRVLGPEGRLLAVYRVAETTLVPEVVSA